MFTIATLILAATAAAEVTTSFWAPGTDGTEAIGFVGSVVGAEKGLTTVAVAYDKDTNVTENTTFTMTVGPNTYAAVQTLIDPETTGGQTYGLGCSVRDAKADASCTRSIGGDLARVNLCADITQQWHHVTALPGTHVLPEWCLSGTTIPESVAIRSLSLARDEIQTFQLVITAGEEKIVGATAGASVTESQATPTGAAASSTAGAIGTESGATPTGAVASSTTETGAARPVRTVAPALAGLGAAVAAFML